jgi:cell division protein FtsI/penicillin-binding protein 2/cell division protein FtsW (lipid II flippase)/DNA uptake protein ComE-like DNA-binding protein
MAKRDRSRGIEGSLLVFALFILLLGALAVFFAKTREGAPAGAVNLNTATADDISVALDTDPALAALLVEKRTALGGFDSVQQAARTPVFVKREDADRVRTAMANGLKALKAADSREIARTLRVPQPVARRIAEYRDALPGAAFAKPRDVARVPILDSRTVAGLGSRLAVRSPAAALWQFVRYGALGLAVLIAAPILLRKAGVGGDPFLLPLGFFLAGLAVLELFSIRDPLRDSPFYTHQIAGLCMGLAAMCAVAIMPVRTRRNLRHYTYVWAILAVVLLLALRAFGHGPEGVRINLAIPVLGDFQPVELIKLLLILFTAGYLTQRGDLMAEALHKWRPPLPKGWAAKWGISVPRWLDMGPLLGMYAVALLLFLVVRDMGPALLLFGAFVSTLYMATGRAGLAWAGIGMMLAGGALAYALHVGVLPTRVDMWLSPWSNAHPNGMQTGQALWAMATGGEEGSGLGLGAPSTVPVVESDLIFAGLGEELGLIGVLAILILFVALIWRGLKIAAAAQNDFDRLLATGLTALLACQTFLIIAGVTGLLPLTGITLPFMARGNTSLVMDFVILGLLRGISAPTGSVPVGDPKPVFRRAARQFATAVCVGLLGLIGIGRLLWIHVLAADRIASNTIRTPDSDGVVRAKLNPRLLMVEKAIPRGTIYDRKNRVVATSRLDQMAKALPDDPERARRLFVRGARYYPYGTNLAHLVGYQDPAVGGPVGIERDFNRELRGFDRYTDLLPDYRNKDLPWRGSRTGRDLVLTVDAEMQETVYRVLKQRVATLTDRRTGKPKKSASLVVLDPLTGETLASVSLPSFDPNNLKPDAFRTLQADSDGAHVLLDRSRYGYYPPGSSLKIATAGAGLEAGLDPLYDCRHTARDLRWSYHGEHYGRRSLSDDVHDASGHGQIKMARAMKVSCNLYYANLGLQLGVDRLHHAFADSDRWALSRVKSPIRFAADLPTNAFGQGTMLATPTEMARIVGAVANHGAMRAPMVVREVRDADGKSIATFSSRVMRQPVSPENAAKLAEMLRSVVTDGTARGVFDAIPVEVAGKTGTAQTEEGDKQPHSWFVGYTPFSRPQYAFACLIENGGYGKQGAAPAIRDWLSKEFGR